MPNINQPIFYANPETGDIHNEDPDLYSEYNEFTQPYPEYLVDGPYTETTNGTLVHYDDVEDPDEIDDQSGYWNYIMGGNDVEADFFDGYTQV